jgi:hypothetical protein
VNDETKNGKVDEKAFDPYPRLFREQYRISLVVESLKKSHKQQVVSLKQNAPKKTCTLNGWVVTYVQRSVL